MHLLVTAGNTQVPIDRVRCITNIFTGRTGTQIALHGLDRGHTVTLLTSHPDVVNSLRTNAPLPPDRWLVHTYRTFDDLQERMKQAIQPGNLDAVIHSAAVSDYQTGGIYAPVPATHFRVEDATWESTGTAVPQLLNVIAGKVK